MTKPNRFFPSACCSLRRLVVAPLVLSAACGGSGGDDDRLGASHITIRQGSPTPLELHVLAHESDGSFAASSPVDKSGVAEIEVPEGGWLTVLSVPSSGRYELMTYVGLGLGQSSASPNAAPHLRAPLVNSLRQPRSGAIEVFGAPPGAPLTIWLSCAEPLQAVASTEEPTRVEFADYVGCPDDEAYDIYVAAQPPGAEKPLFGQALEQAWPAAPEAKLWLTLDTEGELPRAYGFAPASPGFPPSGTLGVRREVRGGRHQGDTRPALLQAANAPGPDALATLPGEVLASSTPFSALGVIETATLREEENGTLHAGVERRYRLTAGLLASAPWGEPLMRIDALPAASQDQFRPTISWQGSADGSVGDFMSVTMRWRQGESVEVAWVALMPASRTNSFRFPDVGPLLRKYVGGQQVSYDVRAVDDAHIADYAGAVRALAEGDPDLGQTLESFASRRLR